MNDRTKDGACLPVIDMAPLFDRGGSADRQSGEPRWDGADLHAFEGTHGDYLPDKVSKVFPGLGERVL
jgi:hypothetical protein